MPLRGSIQEDHIPSNKYKLIIVGLPDITFTEISELEQEVGVVELPDRTRASDGATKPTEITVKVPLHHTLEIAAMEAWYIEGQDPKTPTYKKVGTLIQTSGTGARIRSNSLVGVWISKKKGSALSMESEGDMTANEYTLQIDNVLPI
jgi:hypothetical protein